MWLIFGTECLLSYLFDFCLAYFAVLSLCWNVAELFNTKITYFSLSCVCPVIDHEFRHNIVKVAVEPRGDSRLDPQTTLTML